MDNSLLFLEQVKHNLKFVNYDLIYKLIEDMPNKAVPTARIKKGELIDRVRINKDGQIFNSIDRY